MKFKRTPVLLLMILTLYACQKKVECVTKMKFDKSLWLKNLKRDCYRDREKMLYNFLDTHKIKGLKYSEIVNLLGTTEIVSTSHSTHLRYIVTTKKDSTIEKKYSTELLISLDKDSIVQSYMVALRDKNDK
ncbi:hypothetical protein [Flavobacterium mekongense]|uniref:hypothetical protein n=1 Tax=Flavobacterium mekongense TaxID=3379707 RepID=UPI00399A114D